LGKEVAILRAYPFPPTSSDFRPKPAAGQTAHFFFTTTVSNAEEAFLTCAKELAHARGEAKGAKHAASGAYDMIARMRGREKPEMAQERALQWKLRMEEEQIRMADSVVKEHSGLVRSLGSKLASRSHATHGHSNSASTEEEDAGSNARFNRSAISLLGNVQETKFSIQRLMLCYD
jgi:hypothetical protein